MRVCNLMQNVHCTRLAASYDIGAVKKVGFVGRFGTVDLRDQHGNLRSRQKPHRHTQYDIEYVNFSDLGILFHLPPQKHSTVCKS